MHVARMGKVRDVYKFQLQTWKENTNLRQEQRWRSNFKTVLRPQDTRMWTGFIWLSVQWRASLHTLMSLSDSHKAQNVPKSKLFQDMQTCTLPPMFLSRSPFLRPSGAGSEVVQTRGGRGLSLADFCLRSWKADQQFPHQWTFCTYCRRLVAGRLVIDNDKEYGKRRQSRGWPLSRTVKMTYGTANTSVTIW